MAANSVKGEASIEVGGRTYVLVFSINAMCEVEYILDLSTTGILQKLMLEDRCPVNVIRALLWGGLRTHHPEIDLRGAGDLIEEMGGGGSALDLVGKAMMAAFPDAEEGGAASPKTKAAAGTGRRSSKRGSQSAKTRMSSGE